MSSRVFDNVIQFGLKFSFSLQYLSAPVTKKETLHQDLPHLQIGVSSQQGWRKTQEDSHVCAQLEGNTMLFGVFDGHGGGEVAKFCAEHIHEEIKSIPEFQNKQYGESLIAVFHRMDDMLRTPEGVARLRHFREGSVEAKDEENSFDFIRTLLVAQQGARQADYEDYGGCQEEVQAGCTAVVAILDGNTLYVANAGDSRAVLSRQGKAVALSYDHKPSHPTERERIISAGGFLSEIGGMCRVNGNLNLSRAIGDLKYKSNQELHPSAQIITAEPDIEETTLQKGDEFLVLACDGIWDVMNNQEVIDFVRKGLLQGKTCESIASDILDNCIATDPKENRGIGCDNMTCCIVNFKDEFFFS